MKIPPQTFSTLSHTVSSGIRVFFAVLLVAMPLTSVLLSNSAEAAGIGDRSLELRTGSASGTGGSLPGGVADHYFEFDLPTGSAIGSVKLEYCDKAGATTSFPNCTAPVGINTTHVSLGFADEGDTAVTFDNVSAIETDPLDPAGTNAILLDRTVAGGTGGLVKTTIQNITNPTDPNKTFFVWITSYSGTDGATGPIDTGTVAASTANSIVVTGKMPESLLFCTGASIDTSTPGEINEPGSGLTDQLGNGSTPDCSSATPGIVGFDKLFSPTDTAVAHSQMAASTNADNGYVITYEGTTLLNGGTPIPAIGITPEESEPTTGQFGINLVANSAPLSGLDIDETADGTELKAVPLAPYDTANFFAFVPGSAQPIASSSFLGAGPTNGQIMTVTYMVNVPGNQPAGDYSSTITYVCTAYF